MLKTLAQLFTKEEGYYSGNAAELFDKKELDDIAIKVKFQYDQDLTSCQAKFEELSRIMDMAMIISQEKSYPWNGASNVIYPLVANAAINFGSLCYPEIIQDGYVVKPKIIGSDNGIIKLGAVSGEPTLNEETGEYERVGVGQKLERGNRVATMMNWQLMEQMPWWESDIDKEVHALPILGTLYKKVYYDPLKKMPVSELIFPNRIVINNGARDIDSATITQIIELYPQEILQRIRSGFYVNFDYDINDLANETSNGASAMSTLPEAKTKNNVDIHTQLHTFLEQHTWLDLDEDGFLEPYIVTIHYNSNKVVRIIPRFEEQDISRNEDGEVQEIKACKYFVIRRFMPSFDGSFMGTGFGHLLMNVNEAINSTLNQMIDAGHLANTGGGLIAKNVKIRGGSLSVSPNEYKFVDVMGGDLASSIFPFPKSEPSNVLFTLLGALVEAGKELGSMKDAINAGMASNTAPTTMMILAEQGLKPIRSICMRYFKSIKEELKLLYDINRKYLSNDEYANVLDEPETKVSVKEDFDGRNFDIVPVADINAINSSQKLAQANFLTSFIGNPNVDQLTLIKQIFSTARIPDVDRLVIAAAPQTDPAIQIAQMDAEVKMAAMQVSQQKIGLETEKLKLEIPKLAAEVEKIRSSIMVDFANIGKIGQETELKQQEQQVKMASHLVDAEIEQIKTAANIRTAELRRQNELMKLGHDHVQKSLDREYKAEMAKTSVNKRKKTAKK